MIPSVQPPTEKMAGLSVAAAGEAAPAGPPPGGTRPQREARGPPAEPRTRPDHITDKRGTAGKPIPLRSNFVALRNRPNCALYQYSVTYSPPIESRGLRAGLLSEHTTVIGNVRAFDGMILFLPRRLPDDVTELVSMTKHDQTAVTIKITLTNEVAANSPVSLQIFNVIFRRCFLIELYFDSGTLIVCSDFVFIIYRVVLKLLAQLVHAFCSLLTLLLVPLNTNNSATEALCL